MLRSLNLSWLCGTVPNPVLFSSYVNLVTRNKKDDVMKIRRPGRLSPPSDVETREGQRQMSLGHHQTIRPGQGLLHQLHLELLVLRRGLLGLGPGVVVSLSHPFMIHPWIVDGPPSGTRGAIATSIRRSATARRRAGYTRNSALLLCLFKQTLKLPPLFSRF